VRDSRKQDLVPPSRLLAQLLAEAGLVAVRRLLVLADPARAGGYLYLVPQHLWREPRGPLRAVCAHASQIARASGIPVQFQVAPVEGIFKEARAARDWEEVCWPQVVAQAGSGDHA
jgi:hypothetical protein